MATHTARGHFDVTTAPQDALLDRTGRFGLTKTWEGDLSGLGHGVMLSAGDPGSGSAGYVAIETVEGTLGELAGGFAFVQCGLMERGAPTLSYDIVPGSGHGELAGITGTLELHVDAEGVHHYTLRYTLGE